MQKSYGQALVVFGNNLSTKWEYETIQIKSKLLANVGVFNIIFRK